MKFDWFYLKTVSYLLKKKAGYNLSPEEVGENINDILQKARSALEAKGYDMSKYSDEKLLSLIRKCVKKDND